MVIFIKRRVYVELLDFDGCFVTSSDAGFIMENGIEKKSRFPLLSPVGIERESQNLLCLFTDAVVFP
jgi:hypothetical protein